MSHVDAYKHFAGQLLMYAFVHWDGLGIRARVLLSDDLLISDRVRQQVDNEHLGEEEPQP